MTNYKKPQKNLAKNNNPAQTSPLARLVHLGREKTFITTEDIMREFPEPEKDIETLDRVFAALIAAEIPYIEEED